ncbi:MULTISPECIES: SCP2 sterol-binding domain-containing protein [Salipaludibacillus]|nr:SCP2 sterol-binding domain-containing protein [Salipaludibacillus neizhouensis]
MNHLLIKSMEGMTKTSHLRELLKKHHLIVQVKYLEKRWYMNLDNKDFKLTLDEDVCDIMISGDEDELKLLFRGEDFLLAMKRRGDLEVEGSLKHLLWLESLLYLSQKTVK